MSAGDLVAADEAWPASGLERVPCCPACGSEDALSLYEGLRDRSYRSAPGSWSMVGCRACGAAYLDPRPDEATAPLAYATYYDGASEGAELEPRRGLRLLRRAARNGYLNTRYGYRLAPATSLGRVIVPFLPRHRELADQHVRHLRRVPGGTLLDVGCGEGEFLLEMRSLGWAVTGIEPSAAAAERCRSLGLGVREATFERGLEGTAEYDAITFRLVFEHIRSPREALAACRRALKPNGVVWIATPSLESAAHRAFGRDWIHLEPPRHVVLYSVGSLLRLLSASGFELLAIEPVRQARWSYRLSDALARGRAPFDHAPPLSRRRAIQARCADLIALHRPERADVVVVIARAA